MPSASFGPQTNQCRQTRPFTGPWESCDSIRQEHALAGFAAANDLVGRSDVEVREAIGDKFPKHIYHSIVCIGALVAHWEPDNWAVDAVGAPHVGERTEKQLITAFCDKIAELNPQLVTFNGNSFDLPVLRYRAMVHGVSAPGLALRAKYCGRNAAQHIFTARSRIGRGGA